jgi:pimeloyl-ACP methyl ester carboxylesterase
MPELPAQRSTPRFKTAAGETLFHAAYDAVLAQWPVPVESVDVPSVYGTTHVQVCGPSDGQPLVLLHGGSATSTVWLANVEALSRRHRVYAVDQIGDAGRSVHDGQPIEGVVDLMFWLDCLFDTLGVDAVALGGHSYGAWLALSYAIHAPARVSKLILLEPTNCYTGMKLSFRLRAVPLFARPSADRMQSLIAWETAGIPVDPTWLHLTALAAGEVGKSKLVLPHQFTEAELQSATMPTLVLTAENSKQHDIRRLAANAQRLMPKVAIASLPAASHFTIPTHNPHQLNRELVQFLA